MAQNDTSHLVAVNHLKFWTHDGDGEAEGDVAASVASD
jgi:hypothetical protein